MIFEDINDGNKAFCVGVGMAFFLSVDAYEHRFDSLEDYGFMNAMRERM